LITFIPSEYGTFWSGKEFEQYPILNFLRTKDQVVDRAKELGVPTTIIKTGAFVEFFLMFPYVFGHQLQSTPRAD